MPGILADQQRPPDLGDEAETRPPCTDVTKSSDAAAACPLPRHSSSPESDLNHSSSTCTTSEGECKETPNDPTIPEELDSPLDQSSNQPNQTEPEMEESPPDKEPPIKQKRPVKGPFATELTTMNIHIVLPGVQHPIDAVVSSRDTVHDLLQFSLERPEGCYRTCLSVRFKKKRLDDFFELGAVQDMQDGSTVELVEEPYTQKDIRIHVQRLRDLLAISANPLTHSLSSASGLSLSFLSAITLKDPTEGASRGQESVDPTQLEPPAWSLPQEHPHPPPLTPFYPPSLEAHFKVPECLKSLSYSSWNPPPGYRKMKGDLLYIDLTTLEGQEYYITSCPTGFYLNRSTDRDHFDPAPRKTALHSRHLVGLLSQISPLFKKNFLQLQKFGEKKHAFELFPAPYPVSTWVTPKPEHRPMNFRIDDGVSLKGAPDELLLGQLRDWNEELQLARELPSDTDQQKAFRDRTLFKIHAEFVQAAAKGAVEVMDGYIPSVNPGDEEKHRMYMWNNIFYSLAFDGRDYYEDFGGDDGAHAAAGGDLNGVASFEKLDVKGLCTLGTVVVDYRGVRVVCQTIIPGLLQREQESSVVYGSIDGGKNILANEKFKELLKKPAKELHIREHKLLTEKDEVVELPSSLELKGIIGTDSRHYALDLFRLFPPDRVYMDCEEYQLRHRLSVLRPELLETFLQYRYMLFLKLAKEKAGELNIFKKLQMFMPILRANKKDEASENGEESENSADTVATVEAKVSGEESSSQPPGEGQVCGEESSSQPQGEGQVCGEESSGKPPGEGQVFGEESSSQPPGEGQVCGEESSGKPPGEGQLSGEESSSKPPGEGQVCGEESSSQPQGEGQVCGEESSGQPPGEGQVCGEESSGKPPGESQVCGEESSGKPPGEGQLSGEESSSKPPGEGQVCGEESSSQPQGEGQVCGEESSGKPPGEGQVCGEESSSQPPGEGQVCGEESSGKPPGEGQLSGEESSGKPPGEGQLSGEESSSKPPGEGQVCGEESSSQPPGEGQVCGEESSSQPPGEGQVSGEESSDQPPGEGQVSGEESSGQPPGEGQVCGEESSSQPPKDGQASGQVSESTCDLTVVADSASKKPETTKFESQSKEPNSNLSEEREIGLEDQAKELQSLTKTPLPDPAPQSNEPHTTTTGDNQDTSSNTSSPPAKSKSSASNISADLTNLEALSALLGSNSSNLLILSTDEGQYSQPVTLSEALAGLPGLTEKKVSSAEGEGEPDDDSQDMKNLLDPLDASDIESFSSNPTLLKVLQEAAKESGYGENLDFDIRFNVDILSPGARHADPEAVLESDHNLIDAVTLFLVRIVLPHFLRNCVQLSTMPLDGGALREAMRSQGINVRYLGIIAVMVRQRDDLQHVMRLTVSEMVVRIARRRLRKLMQEAPVQKLSEAIAHFLNCFLGEAETGRDHGEELPLMNGQSRKKQKKKKAPKSRSQPESLYLKMTAKDLWDSIVEEVGWYYRYNLTHSCLGEACSEYGIQRLSLLRELCKKTGVQMVLREYDFSAKPTFTEEDIVSLYPIIKHTNFRPADAVTLLEYAQSKSGNFTNKLARPLYLEALRLFLQVYGPMHVDIADCYGKLADLSLENGDFVDALSNQHKATLILERVLGVDHAQTVFSYIKLANCCQQTNQTSAALRLMYRVRYLILLLHGEDHPHLAACDSNIALLLWSIKDTKNSYCFFQNSLPLYQKYYGKTSTQAALSHHHLARVQCSFGDFRSALQHEKAAYSIYSKKFGVDSEQTKESSAFLQELTEKAVTIQKTLNEMTGKGKPTGTGAKALLLGSWGDVTSMMTKRHGKTNVKKRSKKHPNPPDKSSQD